MDDVAPVHSHTDTAKLCKLERFSPIYTAETLGILFGLHYIETLNTTATKFLIYIDSRSVQNSNIADTWDSTETIDTKGNR